MKYPRRVLGSAKAVLNVPAMGVRCLGGPDDDVTDREQLVKLAIDEGAGFLDMSVVRDGPYMEGWLRAALDGRRESVVLVTSADAGDGAQPGRPAASGRPEEARAAARAALARLGAGQADLYFLVDDDPAVPIEETWGALLGFVEDGSVRYLGLRNTTPDRLRRAHAVHPVTALEVTWSLWSREIETTGLLSAARSLGAGIVATSPLGGGSVRDEADLGAPLPVELASPEELPSSGPVSTGRERIARDLWYIARQRGVSLAQVALAWVLAKGPDVVPVMSARRAAHLLENLDAVNVVLYEREIDVLDLASQARG